MSISAKEVNELRKATGAGMMDCKTALVESEGDFDAAVEILRKKGQKVAAKRADKESSEGSVFLATNDDSTEGYMIALNCETDFVAKNEEYVKLGENIIKEVAKNRPADIAGIMALSIGGRTVQDQITDMIGKIGEKVEISAYEILKGEQVVPYVHLGSKLGVLVALKGTNGTDVTDAAKDVAMQIAAMNPVALDKDGVDKTIVEKEIEIGKEQALAEGKPENLLEKIALGKLNKFYKDNTLLNQDFVKDSSMSVSKYLDSVSKGLTASGFKRVSIG
jgi:elongation factor Ts